MIRDLILSGSVLICLWLTLRQPFAGVLTWTWLTLMTPHREVYGVISTTMRLNFTVAVITILAWLLSKERKLPTVDSTFVVAVAFFAWMTFICIFFAVEPSSSWSLWDRTWRIFALAFVVGAMATDKIRIHALIWVIVVAGTYYGVKGGVLALLSGGTKHVTGPPASVLADNNNLAVALLMLLPLVNYLRLQTANHLVRIGLVAAYCLVLLSILSSYSRGAYVAIAALAVLGWLRSRNKLLYPILAAILVVPALYFMPPEFYARLDTLNAAGEDGSFRGRLDAWYVALSYATDHFPFGAGFDGTGKNFIWARYLPGHTIHAAHSIYFQVLGEHGFVGLALYLTIIFLVLMNLQKVRKLSRGRQELQWAYDLASMMQLSMLVFCTGAAALSLAYFDTFLIWVGLSPALLSVVRLAQTEHVRARSPAVPGLSQGGPAWGRFSSST